MEGKETILTFLWNASVFILEIAPESVAMRWCLGPRLRERWEVMYI